MVITYLYCYSFSFTKVTISPFGRFRTPRMLARGCRDRAAWNRRTVPAGMVPVSIRSMTIWEDEMALRFSNAHTITKRCSGNGTVGGSMAFVKPEKQHPRRTRKKEGATAKAVTP